MNIHSVEVKSLRPTQIALGLKLVKAKRKGLRAYAKKPSELVEYILEHPIRVIVGPGRALYVVDHHHLAHALLDEGFESAPVVVLDDLSAIKGKAFWRTMEAKGWAYPFDAKGRLKSLSNIPTKVRAMQDDPYRSLAGFVRRQGGFKKTQQFYAEFLWANYLRQHISASAVKKNFRKAVKVALALAGTAEARDLPGYLETK